VFRLLGWLGNGAGGPSHRVPAWGDDGSAGATGSDAPRSVRTAQRFVEPGVGRCSAACRGIGLGFLHTASDAGTIRVSARLD
jgi:hypothetical protein